MAHIIPFHDFGGDGPILHFAHANAYPPASYQQFIAPFLRHYHVQAVQHRPLWPGSDPADLQGDWQIIADDLIDFFDQQGLEDVVGVGHSLGAVATLYAAVKRPSLFRALILIEPVFLPPHILQLAAAHPEQSALMPLVQSAVHRRRRWPNRQDAFDRFRSKSIFARWSDEALWDYVNFALRQNEDAVSLIFPPEWEARIYATPPQAVWDALPQIQQPTLGLRAAETDTITPETWQLWQERQPQATFVQLEEVGHLLTMERPSLVAETILNWLSGEVG
ncbi:MAG: alpha/beta hydrolase [Chloroflexi bacterium]|nr:alpha/beta hydrolase [Chloroflexota bacterium]